MAKSVSLIGYPLEHSISPFFQQAAFDYYYLDVRYEAWQVEPARLEATINKLRHPSSLGANVTIPYKEKTLPLLDELEELVIQLGAVNTIVNQDGKLVGYNTDAPAFIQALHQDGGFEPKGRSVVLFGAGGVARAASFALLKSQVKTLTVFNRTFERAKALVVSLKKGAETNTEIAALPWEGSTIEKALLHCNLIVNCTSVGMKHGATESRSLLEARSIPKDALVYDLVYNPVETPLLREAKKAGALTLGGLPMLVYQGAASFKLWTGKEAPVEVMFKAAREALEL